eukprot:Nk52_evm12s234 gene=Nk52_evmTU12s234
MHISSSEQLKPYRNLLLPLIPLAFLLFYKLHVDSLRGSSPDAAVNTILNETETRNQVAHSPGVQKTEFIHYGDGFVLQNNFVSLTFDKEKNSVVCLRADFLGHRRFESDLTPSLSSLPRPGCLLAGRGITSVVEKGDGEGVSLSSVKFVFNPSSESVVVHVSKASVGGEGANGSQIEVIESSEFTLPSHSRSVRVRYLGKVAVGKVPVSRVGVSIQTDRASQYGQTVGGAFQMMGHSDMILPSAEALQRWYAIANAPRGSTNAGAVDVRVDKVRKSHPSYSSSSSHQSSPFVYVYGSNTEGVKSSVAILAIGNVSPNEMGRWIPAAHSVTDTSGESISSQGFDWEIEMTITPNNLNFPSGRVSTTKNLPLHDLHAILMGAYGSPAGCLHTLFTSTKGFIAPTIASPEVGYSNNYNFFDPDNFIALSALLHLSDPYLNSQVKTILLTTSAQMKPDGQMPHHYEQDEWVYRSIARSIQTGPNIFWLLTAIKYAEMSGDTQFILDNYSDMRQMLRYLQQFYDKDYRLLKVHGPLWIDVLVRDHFASDSNAIMPYILHRMADVADYVNKGISQEGKKEKKRDFVDYDSNLLALAFNYGQFNTSFANKIFTRIDKGKYTHIRGTYCSEVKYNGYSDCYIKGGTTCGDSVVTLARIGWVDAIARKVYGRSKEFTDLLLSPLRSDLLENTWLKERYNQQGEQVRTDYYFEYPSLVVMYLCEFKYGIKLKLNTIEIDPFGAEDVSEFTFDIGNLLVDYNREQVTIRLPFSAPDRSLRITGLTPNWLYSVKEPSLSARTDTHGTLFVKEGIVFERAKDLTIFKVEGG